MFSGLYDLTVGERPQVIEIEMAQQNLSRPEIVMSARGLFEGGNVDRAQHPSGW